MPKLQLTALSRRIACSDPLDRKEQRNILDRLSDILRSVDRGTQRDACELLDGALLLTTYLTRLGSVGGTEVSGVVADLLNEAQRVLRIESQRIQMEPGRGHVISSQDPSANQAVGEMLLGEIMLRKGMIMQGDIDAALALKETAGLRFGECLIQIGAATKSQVRNALAYQDECRRLVEGVSDRRVPSLVAGAPSIGSKRESKTLSLGVPSVGDSGGGGVGGLRLVSDCLLGEVMTEAGIVTEEDVRKALANQRVTGMRMGEALVDLGCCTWDDVQRGIELQRGRRGR